MLSIYHLPTTKYLPRKESVDFEPREGEGEIEFRGEGRGRQGITDKLGARQAICLESFFTLENH